MEQLTFDQACNLQEFHSRTYGNYRSWGMVCAIGIIIAALFEERELLIVFLMLMITAAGMSLYHQRKSNQIISLMVAGRWDDPDT